MIKNKEIFKKSPHQFKTQKKLSKNKLKIKNKLNYLKVQQVSMVSMVLFIKKLNLTLQNMMFASASSSQQSVNIYYAKVNKHQKKLETDSDKCVQLKISSSQIMSHKKELMIFVKLQQKMDKWVLTLSNLTMIQKDLKII